MQTGTVIHYLATIWRNKFTMTSNTEHTPTAEPNPSSEKKIVIGVAAIVVTLISAAMGIGIYLMGPSLELINNARQSEQWPQTNAQIASARVAFLEGPVAQGNSLWIPEVSYTYQIDGNSYQGSQIRFAHLDFRRRGARQRAQEVINPYANFPTVVVHYKPDQPEVSVLEPGLTLRSFSLITDAIGFFFIGLVLMAVAGWIFWPRKADRNT